MRKKISNKTLDVDVLSDSLRLKKASMALEDLVWNLKGSRFELLLDASKILSDLVNASGDLTIVKSYKSKDPNKHFLIGVLPKLFQDRKLFPQNDDIVDFALSALNLNMSRAEKRSRYEIIGKVICETDTLDEQKLTDLVRALELLLANQDGLAKMAEMKKLGSFSWNETIQELLGSSR